MECTDPESPDFALKKRKIEWDSKKVIDLSSINNAHEQYVIRQRRLVTRHHPSHDLKEMLN